MKILQFLQDDNNRMSSTRLIFLFYSIFAVFMAVWVYKSSKNVTDVMTIFIAISGVGSATKLTQKGIEKKDTEIETKSEN